MDIKNRKLTEEGNRINNITEWGLEQFQTHYEDPTITKLDIFHYTYMEVKDMLRLKNLTK